MDITLEGMTLQTLLQQHGITTIRELTHRTGLSRQQCWNLWHGQAGVGKETLKRLHERLGIPLEALLEVDPVPRRKPRQTGKKQMKRQGSSASDAG
jgi:transcriptional regulator with XRE-family HTH domain